MKRNIRIIICLLLSVIILIPAASCAKNPDNTRVSVESIDPTTMATIEKRTVPTTTPMVEQTVESTLTATVDVLSEPTKMTDSMTESIPDCSGILADIPIRQIIWNGSDSLGITGQLAGFINSPKHNNMNVFSNSHSYDGQWVFSLYVTENEPGFFNTKTGEIVPIQLPPESGINFMDFGIWSPDNVSVIIPGLKYMHPYERNGVLIVNGVGQKEINVKYYRLPEERESHIDLFWLEDGRMFGVLEWFSDNTTDQENHWLHLVDTDGNAIKTVKLPSDTFFSNLYWDHGYLYFTRERGEHYSLNRINVFSENTKPEKIYESDKPLFLLGASTQMNEILFKETYSQDLSCVRAWNFWINEETTSITLPTFNVSSYSGDGMVGIDFAYSKKDENFRPFLLFDWINGFKSYIPSFVIPIGWNSEVNAFLFVKDDYPNSLVGYLEGN